MIGLWRAKSCRIGQAVVGRSIVDDDDLIGRPVLLDQGRQRAPDEVPMIVVRQYD